MRYRNDLAYIRQHLKTEGLIYNKLRNKWEITAYGKAHFCVEVYERLRELTQYPRVNL